MTTPSQIPAQEKVEGDEDITFLTSILPQDAATRKRSFSYLLRQIVSEKGGSR